MEENNNVISLTKKPRLMYIDLLRGYTMLLVVIGHCWMGDAVGEAMILAFHMPLFFFLSGFLFRHIQAFEKGLVPFVADKFRQLIIPYFVFEFINLVISLLIVLIMVTKFQNPLHYRVLFYALMM